MDPKRLPSFSAPFTPEGRGGLVPSFPRDQAIRALAFHFRADPAVLNRFIPPPLAPVADHPGEAFFMYAEHLAPPVKPGWRDWHPRRIAAVEGLLGPVCEMNGRKGVYYGYNWVDNDWDMMVMWLFGCQAKIANFHLTATNPAHPHLPGLASGATYRMSVDRLGQRLISGSVTLDQRASLEDLPLGDYLHAYMMRHFPDMNMARNGRPLVHDLVTEVQTNHVVGEIWKGVGELDFFPAENEELEAIRPQEILGAYHVHFSYRTSGVEVLHDYLAG